MKNLRRNYEDREFVNSSKPSCRSSAQVWLNDNQMRFDCFLLLSLLDLINCSTTSVHLFLQIPRTKSSSSSILQRLYYLCYLLHSFIKVCDRQFENHCQPLKVIGFSSKLSHQHSLNLQHAFFHVE